MVVLTVETRGVHSVVSKVVTMVVAWVELRESLLADHWVASKDSL